jgi:hypothetical protein
MLDTCSVELQFMLMTAMRVLPFVGVNAIVSVRVEEPAAVANAGP